MEKLVKLLTSTAGLTTVFMFTPSSRDNTPDCRIKGSAVAVAASIIFYRICLMTYS